MIGMLLYVMHSQIHKQNITKEADPLHNNSSPRNYGFMHVLAACNYYTSSHHLFSLSRVSMQQSHFGGQHFFHTH